MKHEPNAAPILDYATPAKRAGRRLKGKAVWGGVGIGLLISLLAWPGLAIAASNLAIDYSWFSLAGIIVVLKVAMGVFIELKTMRIGYVAGVLISMPLVGTCMFGAVAFLVANMRCC